MRPKVQSQKFIFVSNRPMKLIKFIIEVPKLLVLGWIGLSTLKII